MPRDWRIKPAATEEEWSQATKLLNAVYVGGNFTAPSVARQVFSRAHLESGGDLLVAVGAEGEIAGTVVFLNPQSSLRQLARDGEAEIRLLAVDETARRKGIARLLVAECLHRALRVGVEKIVLSTQPSMTAAQALYASFGFVRNPARDWHAGDGSIRWAYGLNLPRLSIRPMEQEDAVRITEYWMNASPEDLRRMGADRSRFPPREQFLAGLSAPRNFYLVWLLDGEPVGYSSLKNIVSGEHGEMHLHIWAESARGRGYGAVFFCQSALEFYRRFELKSIVCEPSAKNAMPNRMLEKIGFAVVRRYTGASSDLSAVCELNRYAIDRRVAEEYILGRGGL